MDSALSRCACRLSLVLIAFILLLRGVPLASVRPVDNRRLFVRADTIVRDAETGAELITAPLAEALESSGLFSSLAAMSSAGSVHITARLSSAAPSSFSAEDAAGLIHPFIGPYLARGNAHISVSPGYADFPAACLLFRPSEEETGLEFSRSVRGYLERLSGRLRECGGVRVFGLSEEELTVTVDPARAAGYGMEISRLHSALIPVLSGSIGAGVLESGEIALPLFITHDIHSIAGLGALPAVTSGAYTVPLREIARISLDVPPPVEPAYSPEGEAAVIAEINTLSRGDISFYHALSKVTDRERGSLRVFPVPSETISRNIEVLRLFPLALFPLLFILLFYPEKGRSAAAAAMELVLILIIILLEGIATPRTVMIVLLVIPLGPAAALCFGVRNDTYPPLGALLLFQVLLFPLRESELLLFAASLVSALLAGASAESIIEDGPFFEAIGMFSSALLIAAAILIISPPFLTCLNAGSAHIAHASSEAGWSFVASDARFLEGYPGIVPPGTETAFLQPGTEVKPLPLRISGERMRIEIREDSPLSKEKSIALLSGLLEYPGQRHKAGVMASGDGKEIPVYLAVEKCDDPGRLPVHVSGKTFLLSSLANFETVREVLYVRRWTGSGW